MAKSIFDTDDIKEQNLGNIQIINKEPGQESPVAYAIPPDIQVIGVNAPKYDCCVQKVIDEMGKHIGLHKMQFVLGNDNSPGDIVPYFPSYVLYFRSGTQPNTHEGILANLAGYMAYYRGLGMPIFYYLDDYLVTINNNAPLKLMLGCDGIIVATPKLKELLQNEHKVTVPIHVVKTHMDLVTYDMLQPIDTYNVPGQFNILFSSQGRIGIQLFYEIVQRMNNHPERYKNVNLISLSHQVAQVRSIINNCRNLRKTYLEWLPIELYYRLARSMHLILAPASIGDLDYMMPRELQQTWLDCKSAHKYTLAGAAGIPCIASPTEAYKDAINHGTTGFVADGVEQWIEYIDLMINDKAEAKRIGDNARKDVVDNWSLYRRVDEMVSIFTGRKSQTLTEASTRTGVELVKEVPSLPKVMTFIPTHNQEKFIRECLDSIVSQSYPNHEIILGDNASTDNTVKIVQEEYPMVKILQTDKFYENANPLYNDSIRMTDAEFTVDIAGDDKMVPNFWETILPHFKNEKVGFVRIGWYTFSESYPEGVWARPEPWVNPLDILIRNKVHISSPMRCSVMKKIGDTDISLVFSDWDKWIRVVLADYKWSTCQKPMVWYRRHAGAISLTYDMDLDGPVWTSFRNKWMPTLIKYGIRASNMASAEMITKAKEQYKDVVTFDEVATKEKQLSGREMLVEARKASPLKELEAPMLNLTNKNLTFSCYVPVHNVRPWIEECLDSILDQTHPFSQIVISDNGSTDGTGDLIKSKYKDPRIVYNRIDPYTPGGNSGVKPWILKATADVLCCLGGDDRLVKTYAEEATPYFLNDPKLGLLRIGCYQFSEETPEGSTWLPKPMVTAEQLLDANSILLSSPARRECWQSIQGKKYIGFTGGVTYTMPFSDWDHWLQMILLERWKWADCVKPLYWYRRRSGSHTFSIDYGATLEQVRKRWMPYVVKYERWSSTMLSGLSPDEIKALTEKGSEQLKEERRQVAETIHKTLGEEESVCKP